MPDRAVLAILIAMRGQSDSISFKLILQYGCFINFLFPRNAHQSRQNPLNNAYFSPLIFSILKIPPIALDLKLA